MEAKKILIIIGVILLVVIGCFYLYIRALGSMWDVNTPNKSPYFITDKPIVVNNILVPKETKITYKKRYFWEKYEQKKPLKQKDITRITFKEGITIDWGGIPIKEMIKFFNPKMKGYTVYANFNSLNKNKKTQFYNLWKSCNSELGITVKNTDDWSFNKKNIIDIQSCGSNQRYFSEDKKQQLFLDNLYNELTKIKD